MHSLVSYLKFSPVTIFHRKNIWMGREILIGMAVVGKLQILNGLVYCEKEFTEMYLHFDRPQDDIQQ